MTELNNKTLGVEDMQIDTAIAVLTIKAIKAQDNEQIKYVKLIDIISKHKEKLVMGRFSEKYNTISEVIESITSDINKNMHIINAFLDSAENALMESKRKGVKVNHYISEEVNNSLSSLEKSAQPLVAMRDNGICDCGLLQEEDIALIKSTLHSYRFNYTRIVNFKNEVENHNKITECDAILE